MHIFSQVAALPDQTAACIGAFDGLHLGHQSLLHKALQSQPKVALVSFHPHPATLLTPESAPPLLQTPEQRIRVCKELGVDVLVLVPFDTSFAALSPTAFVEQVLLQGLQPATVVVGPDFRFGAQRKGDVSHLQQLLQAAHVPLVIGPEIVHPHDSQKLSSSQIRNEVRLGHLHNAAAMLGRWYTSQGQVIHGAKRGQKLGFPTANIANQNDILPPPGVYAVAFRIVDEKSPLIGQIWPGVANLGHAPTFNHSPADMPMNLEVHVLDVDLDHQLYGLCVEVAWIDKLREERRFASIEHLTAQIHQDIAQARPLLTAQALNHMVATPLRSCEPAAMNR